MSLLSSFPPSQTKAICLPSAEKAAWSSVPAKLVTGLIVNSGDGGFGFDRKRNAHTPTARDAPKTTKINGSVMVLIKDHRRGLTTASTSKACKCGESSPDFDGATLSLASG